MRKRSRRIPEEALLPPGELFTEGLEFNPIQTVQDVLPKIRNDYSQLEERFDLGIGLVDHLAHFSSQKPRRVDKARFSLYKRYLTDKGYAFNYFLQQQKHVKTLSIILPIGSEPGRKGPFLECLKSILRQTFLACHPANVELVIVQDGEARRRADEPISPAVAKEIIGCAPGKRPRLRLFKLKEGRGRSIARNIGLLYASNEIAFFIDSSMVLDSEFLAQHMLRHQRVDKIALIGFKEKISQRAYQGAKEIIANGQRRAEYWKNDWKWVHKLKPLDGPFPIKWGRHEYNGGDLIRYMKITNHLKALRGDEGPGPRQLPTFFHTGITSVPLDEVRKVGGFAAMLSLGWGFEDTFLGALLLAKGNIKLLPCPSSVAFQIEHNEPEMKEHQLEKNRKLYQKLLQITIIENLEPTLLQDCVVDAQRGNSLYEGSMDGEGKIMWVPTGTQG